MKNKKLKKILENIKLFDNYNMVFPLNSDDTALYILNFLSQRYASRPIVDRYDFHHECRDSITLKQLNSLTINRYYIDIIKDLYKKSPKRIKLIKRMENI